MSDNSFLIEINTQILDFQFLFITYNRHYCTNKNLNRINKCDKFKHSLIVHIYKTVLNQ
jgi:hypothetical protein